MNGTVKKIATVGQGATTISLAGLLAFALPILHDTVTQKNDLRVRINNMEINECATRGMLYRELELKGWHWFEGACEREE